VWNRKQLAKDWVIEVWIERELELESESGCVVKIRNERMEEMKQVRAITNTASRGYRV